MGSAGFQTFAAQSLEGRGDEVGMKRKIARKARSCKGTKFCRGSLCGRLNELLIARKARSCEEISAWAMKSFVTG